MSRGVVGPAALELHEVSRVYGQGSRAVHALMGVSMTVRAGELVAIMGPSGSGKSTLLALAGGLDTPTSGRVSVAGEDLDAIPSAQRAGLRRRFIGYVFQDLNLISSLSAGENVSLPLEFDGMKARLARRKAVEALALVGLGELEARFPDEMSGGQQQRVAIARAVVGSRQLLLADEPTGALDSGTGAVILGLIRRLCDEGAAGVLVTHDSNNAAWADRVVNLVDGEVAATPDAVGRSAVTGSPNA